jgi:hypothetical protein
MNSPDLINTDTLIDNLALRDVPYFAGPATIETPLISDEALLTGLICHEAARVRLGLIPLLLYCPELGTLSVQVEKNLSDPQKTLFWLYYTATVFLQNIYKEELQAFLGLQPQLPDWFSISLKVEGTTSEEKLQSLAKLHAQFTGLEINWLGTYRHGATQLLRQLHLRELWELNTP